MTDYPWGWDAEWIAVDRVGRIGVFTTGGEGPIPTVYLTQASLLDKVCDAVWSLPEVTEHELLVTLPRPDDFVAFARRGLFSFDWADAHRVRGKESGRYEIQARPKAPVKVDAVPWQPELRSLLEQVTTSLDFGNTTVDVASVLACASP